MKAIIIILIFNLQLNVFAESTKTIEAGCLDGADCTPSDVSKALDAAHRDAIILFENATKLADQNQSEICQSQVQKFRDGCNQTKFDRTKDDLESIKLAIETRKNQVEAKNEEIEQKTIEIATTGKINRQQSESRSLVADVVSKLETLKSEIEKLKEEIDVLNQELSAAKTFVNETSAELRQMRQACTAESEAAETLCQAPTAVTNGDTTMIVENNLTRSGTIMVEPGEAIAGQANAVSIVTANGAIAAPLVGTRRRNYDRIFDSTMISSTSATESLNETFVIASESVEKAQTASAIAIDSINQIDTIISSLQPLNGYENNGICTPLPGQPCPPIDDDQDPAVQPVRPRARPDTTAGTGTGNTGTGNGGPTGGNSSAEQLGDQALNSAFGGSNDNTGSGGGNLQTGTAGANPNGGGLAGALSGLSSVLGKTSGGFGDSSSYGSDYGNYRSGSSSSGSGNYTNNPNPNYNTFNPSLKTNGKPQAPGQARVFQPQSAGAGGVPAIGGAGGQGSNLGGFNSSGSGSGGQDSKPGLLSRLFGKKDKNMFGKASGGGGGSMSGATSKAGARGASSGSSYDDMDPAHPTNPNGRTFDPNKYMPSKEAEERAYLRSTGRKMASRGIASAADFQWPDDISRNKNLNLFKTVNLIHRAKLAQ